MTDVELIVEDMENKLSLYHTTEWLEERLDEEEFKTMAFEEKLEYCIEEAIMAIDQVWGMTENTKDMEFDFDLFEEASNKFKEDNA